MMKYYAGLLSIFVAAEISGQRVVLDGLVQHQGKKTRSVGHGGSDVTLLLEKLVQLVPLRAENEMKHHKGFEVPRGHEATADSPPGPAPGPPLPSSAFPSCNACCISSSRPCRILPSAQRRSSLEDTRRPHPRGPEDRTEAASLRLSPSDVRISPRFKILTVANICRKHKQILKSWTFSDLWISGMFWTQNLKPLAIGFALRVVHVTEESGCSVEDQRMKADWNEFITRHLCIKVLLLTLLFL